MSEDTGVSQLVVVGASAGGIDALSTLLGGLPAGLPAPIVIAQHLDPRRPSHLGEILARRSALSVRVVEDRQKLEPGTVYVVPANRHVEIDDHSVASIEASDGGPRPSVDHLLETAAVRFGENLLAVILTGAGSDGAVGARAVKAAGGTVIIQNPETASFSSMPSSLSPSTVDAVANLDAIPGLIVALLDGDPLPERSDDDRSFDELLVALREQTGVDFSAYKRGTIRRRLQRRMVATGVSPLDTYIAFCRDNPDERRRLVASFLIKVTEFFRDPELYQELRTRIIPELIAEARNRDRELRIWSAGCATGEEAYSVAILVAEALGPEIASWNVRIFATDLDSHAIAFARRGIYAEETVADVPTGLLERYFRRSELGYTVEKAIRSMIVFGDHDLAQRAPFPRIDLALCRNVLIYFNSELQRRALQLFAFSLREGGLLVLGKSETTGPLPASFVLEDSRLKVYRRQGPRVVLPAIATTALPPPLAPRRARPLPSAGASALAARPAQRADTLLLQLPVGVVVVNRDYDIQSINTRARELLRIHGPAEDRDLVHLTRNLHLEGFRDAIDRALGGRATEFHARIETGSGVESHDVRVEAHPMPDRDGSVGGAVILVHPLAFDHGADQPDPGDGVLELAPDRARRLLAENRELYADNAELTTANAVLRTQNEELLVSSEEAQAATEEVETLNEELQATNEELETLNEELQSTVEELNSTNEDMAARALELQELGLTLTQQSALTEEGRARLASVISAMRDAVVVIDRHGADVLHNGAYAALAARADVLEGGELDPASPARLRDRASHGETFTLQFKATEASGERHWFEVVGQPVRDGNEPTGGVLVIRDITERSLAALQDEFVGIVAHELRTPLTALRGYVQLMHGAERDGGSPSGAAQYGRHALEQVDRLASIVADLVDATRIQTGRLRLNRRAVNLAETVRDTVAVARALAPGFPVNLTGGEDLWVEADTGRLQQVLLNLLTNAASYAPGPAGADVRLYAENGHAVVEIQDHGPGMTPAQLRTLFRRERAEPSSGSGLGLGLYIAHEIVDALGGTLTARSSLGAGTTMTVHLPSIDPPAGDA